MAEVTDLLQAMRDRLTDDASFGETRFSDGELMRSLDRALLLISDYVPRLKTLNLNVVSGTSTYPLNALTTDPILTVTQVDFPPSPWRIDGTKWFQPFLGKRINTYANAIFDDWYDAHREEDFDHNFEFLDLNGAPTLVFNPTPTVDQVVSVRYSTLQQRVDDTLTLGARYRHHLEDLLYAYLLEKVGHDLMSRPVIRDANTSEEFKFAEEMTDRADQIKQRVKRQLGA